MVERRGQLQNMTGDGIKADKQIDQKILKEKRERKINNEEQIKKACVCLSLKRIQLGIKQLRKALLQRVRSTF